jgi:hypothetical protein
VVQNSQEELWDALRDLERTLDPDYEIDDTYDFSGFDAAEIVDEFLEWRGEE